MVLSSHAAVFPRRRQRPRPSVPVLAWKRGLRQCVCGDNTSDMILPRRALHSWHEATTGIALDLHRRGNEQPSTPSHAAPTTPTTWNHS